MQSNEQTKLAQALRAQLVNCVGYAGDSLSENRTAAYNYYFQRARGDEIAGRSEIVTGDLSSMVEGNLAQMLEPLLAKRIAEFCAYDQADEEQAQLESDCVTEMLFRRQNGFIEVASAVKDALLIRNAVIKVYVDERTHTQRVRRKGVAPDIVTTVLDQIGTTEVHSYDPETGELSATVTKTTRQFRLDALAPENFLHPAQWHRQDLEDIPFCAERHVEPRSTLVERGFEPALIDLLPRWNYPQGGISDARRPRQLSSTTPPLDTSQELVEWYECYARLDDGTGAARLHRIALGDLYILEDDDTVGMIGYATGVAIINPHSFIGISLYDKLKTTQDSTTALTRALMDNLNATNKNRTAHLDGVVEEADLTDGRTNGSIRVNPGRVTDVRAAITAFAVPDTSANILQNLEHMRRTRAELGGAALDMSSGMLQLNERVGSQGLDRAYSVMEQHAAFMMRTIANTLIRQLYLVAHEVLRTQWQEPISFRRGNLWVQQMPAKWPVRQAVTVNLGAPLGERTRVSAALEKLLEKQAWLAANGMEDILVSVDTYHAAILQWLRVNDLEVPEKYILDPRLPQAQKALQGRAISKQQATVKQDNLMNQAIALEQLRTALEKYKTDAELQFKYYAEVLNAQIEEAKLSTSAVVDLTKTRAQGRAAANERKPDGTDTAADDTGSAPVRSDAPKKQSAA